MWWDTQNGIGQTLCRLWRTCSLCSQKWSMKVLPLSGNRAVFQLQRVNLSSMALAWNRNCVQRHPIPFLSLLLFFLNRKSQCWKHFENKMLPQVSRGVFNWHHHDLNFTPYVWPCFVKYPTKWVFPHNSDIWIPLAQVTVRKDLDLENHLLTCPRCHSTHFKIPRNKCTLCLSLEQGNLWKGTGHI